MEPKKILVKEGNTAIATCPSCRKIRKLSVGKYKKQGKRHLKIKCSCKELYDVFLEFRRYPRKPIKLIGKSFNLSKRKERQDIIVRNISLGGIGFLPFTKHRTEMYDQLVVSFELDDANHTPIDAQVTVRVADENYVGCEFNSNDRFKQNLGFYLIS
jgi:hypothetical protein